MALTFQPRPGFVVMCDFRATSCPKWSRFVLFVVLARNRKACQLVTVVPLSTTRPEPLGTLPPRTRAQLASRQRASHLLGQVRHGRDRPRSRGSTASKPHVEPTSRPSWSLQSSGQSNSLRQARSGSCTIVVKLGIRRCAAYTRAVPFGDLRDCPLGQPGRRWR